MEVIYLISLILLILFTVWCQGPAPRPRKNSSYTEAVSPIDTSQNCRINNDIYSITKETLLNELSIAETEYKNYSFFIIKENLSIGINEHYREIINFLVTDRKDPREWVYSVIGNKAGALITSGHYHVYRGHLDINGQELLAIFDKTLDLLLKINAKGIDINYASEQKAAIRACIQRMG